MSDLERLDEAIHDVVLLRCEDHSALLPVLDAARAYRDLLANPTHDKGRTCERTEEVLDNYRSRMMAAERLLANGERVDTTAHLCEAIHEDEIGFYYAACTCGEYRTMPVPDRELLVDELMAHAARAAVSKLLVDPTTEEER